LKSARRGLFSLQCAEPAFGSFYESSFVFINAAEDARLVSDFRSAMVVAKEVIRAIPTFYLPGTAFDR
jgi:hypothetical protein